MYGPTTWRCECGATQVTEDTFALPFRWMQLNIRIGTRDGVVPKEERTYCPACASDYRRGPAAHRAKSVLNKLVALQQRRLLKPGE